MKKMKRVLSLLLALVLVLGYVPVKAEAADEWLLEEKYATGDRPAETDGDNVVWDKGGLVGNPNCGKEVHQHEKICYPALPQNCIHMGKYPGEQYSVHREEYCYATPKPEDITLCTAGSCTKDHWLSQDVVNLLNSNGIYTLIDKLSTPTNTQRELAKVIKAKFNAEHPDGVRSREEANAYLSLKWHINRTVVCEHKCNDDCIAWSSTTRFCGKIEHSHKETCYTGSYWYQYADTNNDNVPDKDQKLKMTLITNGGTLPTAVTSPYEISASKQNWETIMQTTTAPTRAGFTFTGWYADENLTEKVLTKYVTPPVGEKTFYAAWSLDAPAVELNREGLVLIANASHNASDVTYTYTWSKDGSPVEGTSKQLTISEEGTYTVSVTATKDGITSTAAQKSIAVDHIHVWEYSAKDNAIVATCQKDSSHVETATVVAPTSTSYTGADILASVVYSDEWPGGAVTPSHSGDTKNVTTEGVTAKITRDEQEASVHYTISPMSLEGLKAESSGEYNGAPYSPELQIGDRTMEQDKDYTLGEWSGNLTDVGKYSVMITGIGNYTGQITGYHEITRATPTADLFQVTMPSNAVYEKDKTHEAVVSVKDGVNGLGSFTVKYSDKPENAGVYTVLVDVNEGKNYETAASISLGEFTVSTASQNPPNVENLKPTHETVFGKKDGKIQISGNKENLQYKLGENGTYKDINSGVLENLEPGKYYFRYKAYDNHSDSADSEPVEVKAGQKLKVTLPTTAEQVEYKLTVNPAEASWEEEPVLTLEVKAGYELTDDFAMTLTYETMARATQTEIVRKDKLEAGAKAGEFTCKLPKMMMNVKVTKVEGIVDNTAPQIQAVMNGTTYSDVVGKNDVKFNTYVKSGTVTASAIGGGSPVTIKYAEFSAAKDIADIKDSDWKDYPATGITLRGDGNKVFYFKATDASGKGPVYVSTNGVVLDTTAPSLSLGTGTKTFGITRRVTVADKNLASIKINDISQKIEGSDGKDRTAITYRITKDADTKKEKTYIFEVRDKAGNVTKATYTVEPMKFLEKGKSWSQGSKKTLDFKVNAVLGNYADVDDYDMKFQVKIKDKEIDAKNYTVEEAADGTGTFIKLKPDYLKGLKAGKYKIAVSVVANKSSGTGTETLDSTETVEFSVSNNPKTGDSMNLTLWGGMAMLSLMAAAMLVLGKKRIR